MRALKGDEPSRSRNEIASALSVIPEKWVPSGVHDCCIAGPACTEYGRLSRTPDRIEILLHGPHAPQVACIDRKDGRVSFFAQMPHWSTQIFSLGRLKRRGRQILFEDDSARREGRLSRLTDGRLSLELRQGDGPVIQVYVSL